jgi:mannan endo-1,4-beta-mannosidase
MDRAFLELHLAMAERKNARQRAHKPLVVGRPWWNFALLALVIAISMFVYRSPSGVGVRDELTDVAQVGPDAVRSFGSMLDQLVGSNNSQSASKAVAKSKHVHQPKASSGVGSGSHGKHHNQGGAPASTSTTTPGVTPAQVAMSTSMPKVQHVAPPRAPSPPVTAPPLSSLIKPTTSYYGIANPVAPFDMSGVNALDSSVGKSPNLLMYFQSWDTTFNPFPVEQSWRTGALPVISWEPRMTTPGATQPTLATIANGSYDSWLEAYAAAVRATGLPIGMRFAHEMNGTWYPWSEGIDGNQPGDYVRAWRHIHDVFVNAGATNVIWIWSPNIINSTRPNFDLSSVYPGDAYVDWAALTGYFRRDTGQTPSFDTTFDASLAEVRAITKKPILLSEIGAGTTEVNRVTWLNSLFAALPNNPDIIGFVYFDQNKLSEGKDDWRIEAFPQVLQAFSAGVANPRYG